MHDTAGRHMLAQVDMLMLLALRLFTLPRRYDAISFIDAAGADAFADAMPFAHTYHNTPVVTACQSLAFRYAAIRA